MQLEWLTITLRFVVVAVALAALLHIVLLPRKQWLQIIWGVFCGSVALAMLEPAGGTALGPYAFLLGFGACATCNAYWLVTRGLFQQRDGFRLWQLILAGSVTGLLLIRESLRLAVDVGQTVAPVLGSIDGGLSELIAFLGVIMLALTMRELVHQFSKATPVEQHWRKVLLSIFLPGILLITIWPGLSAGWPELAVFQGGIEALVATAIVAVTHYLVVSGVTQTSAAATSASDNAIYQSIAAELQQTLQSGQAFLNPDLRVADLAQHIGVPEYLLSKAISNATTAANFNQLVNHYRIDYAARRLRQPGFVSESILHIALDSGFASIGPFNRAFKTQYGMPPSQYRNQAGQPADWLTISKQ